MLVLFKQWVESSSMAMDSGYEVGNLGKGRLFGREEGKQTDFTMTTNKRTHHTHPG